MSRDALGAVALAVGLWTVALALAGLALTPAGGTPLTDRGTIVATETVATGAGGDYLDLAVAPGSPRAGGTVRLRLSGEQALQLAALPRGATGRPARVDYRPTDGQVLELTLEDGTASGMRLTYWPAPGEGREGEARLAAVFTAAALLVTGNVLSRLWWEKAGDR